MRICFVPVNASEKLTSIEGLVSKLSERLQQAAFNNSSLLTYIVFWASK
jgi:C4-type Zn-finger protein